MKPPNAGPRKSGVEGRKPPVRIAEIPMEWMDPMSWRLPSGKKLAEFALQAGFLAPLMLGSPFGASALHRKKRPPPLGLGAKGPVGPARQNVDERLGEGSAAGIAKSSGSLRETGVR